MRRTPPLPPQNPRHAQRRRVVSEGHREAILGLAFGSAVAAGFLVAWLAAGAPL